MMGNAGHTLRRLSLQTHHASLFATYSTKINLCMVDSFQVRKSSFVHYILFIDCAHSKFGSTLTSRRQPSKVNYVASSSECADSCEEASCNFWSFEGININSDTTYLHHLWSRVYQDKLCLRKVLQV